MKILNENPRETIVPAEIIIRRTSTGYELELVETSSTSSTELYYCEKVDMYVQIPTEKYRNSHPWCTGYLKDSGDPSGPDLEWMGVLLPHST